MRKPSDVTRMDDSQTPQLNALIEDIYIKSLSIKYVDEVPTIDSVSNNELVVYDNGAGTKRLYVVTNKKNLGYVTLI